MVGESRTGLRDNCFNGFGVFFMAKGFDTKQEEKLGYVLVLLPEPDAYAARLSFYDGSEGEFIGITNMLSEAQVWKTKKQARQAIVKYSDLIEEQMETERRRKYYHQVPQAET